MRSTACLAVAPRLAAPLVASLLAAALFTASAQASVVFVRASAPAGGSGQSWATAFRSLRDALTHAAGQPGVDQIWVAAGRYTPHASDRNATFTMRSGLSLYGGFAGSESLLTQRNPAVNITTLSGDLSNNDGPGFVRRTDNSRHVVTATATTSGLLDGFTISGGNADFPGDDLAGGGAAHMNDARFAIANCLFTSNIAGGTAPDLGGFGGALLIRGGEVAVRSCRFEANRGMNGGALGVAGFTQDRLDIDTVATITDCDFVSNFSPSQTGGAIWSATGDPLFGGVVGRITMRGCSFIGNSAEYFGAWTDQNTPELLVEDCVFRGNTAIVHGGAFGTGWTAGPESPIPTTVRRCLFEENTITEGDGAAFFAAARSAVIESCTIRRNDGTTAIRSGPVIGFANGARNLTVLNSLVHDNTGVGVFGFRNPQLAVISSTIARNVSAIAGGLAGGIETSAADFRVFNTILWDNRRAGVADEPAQLRSFTVAPQVSFCDIQGLTGLLGGAGNIGLDPLFTGPAAGNFVLGKASPAIDAGSNARAASGVLTDLRGLPRFLNDPSKPDTGVGPGPVIDMGAFEALPRIGGAARPLPPAGVTAAN